MGIIGLYEKEMKMRAMEELRDEMECYEFGKHGNTVKLVLVKKPSLLGYRKKQKKDSHKDYWLVDKVD